MPRKPDWVIREQAIQRAAHTATFIEGVFLYMRPRSLKESSCQYLLSPLGACPFLSKFRAQGARATHVAWTASGNTLATKNSFD